MDQATYNTNVAALESVPDTINFSPIGVHAMLSVAVFSAQLLDTMKRAIYYGKPFDDAKFDDAMKKLEGAATFIKNVGPVLAGSREQVLMEMSKFEVFSPEVMAAFKTFSTDNTNIRLLHAVVGMFTESGELAEALAKQIMGHELDAVNVKEEIGDVEWYRAVAMMVLEMTDEELRSMNIKKLMDKKSGRYKSGKFSSEEATERDTDAERQVLEEASNT